MAHRKRWIHADELLALVLEKLDELVILTVRVNSDPKRLPKKAPKPYRYPRPVKPTRAPPATLDEIRTFFRR